MSAVFRSLATIDYRIWFAGALVSNVGTWMQRTAQDWIVLTELSDHDAVALGITTALQLGPQLLLVPLSGLIADRFDRRRTLMLTQLSMGLLGAALGAIVLLGVAQLWIVYVFALLLGIASAIDAPVRQTFVSELVTGPNLGNAVALNSASFNAARTIGPAVAGLLVVAVGAGWVFLINAISFAAVLVSLRFIRPSRLVPVTRAPRSKGQLLEGFRYVRGRPDLMVIFVIVFVIGTFGFNYAIFTSTMATVEFGLDSAGFGLLTSIMAVGSVAGALLSASRDKPRGRLVVTASLGFGVAALAAALSPGYAFFAVTLVAIGFAGQVLMTTANGTVQTTTDPAMRGRVMALYMAIFMGGTPIGAPVLGAVANTLGPRWALGVAALAGVVAFAIGAAWLVVYRDARLRRSVRGVRLEFGPGDRMRDQVTATGSFSGVVGGADELASAGERADAARAEELREDLETEEADARRA
ncbi:MFS transporter [Herbiconiux sp. KACC 21604]|uniref:MFS transporter n=1 Tax=unclassified Herbiconiux TaxID=2618217 RepID=UPI001490C029|nr:MFS transporter [Herbiconiux sp. SALV-R1]QJU52849.1 MFS transporter [Herbiconiux sp. SALV-R1]WPO87765.1 MFS transporter [Herbiconiux sp. KACC 21604]